MLIPFWSILFSVAYTAPEIVTFITAIGVAVSTVMVVMQKRVIKQVEIQGNARDLENKRVVAMFARRLARKGNKTDKVIATQMERAYQAALKSVKMMNK